jgi:hypothetical protein
VAFGLGASRMEKAHEGQSVFLLHEALRGLHPKVRQFVLVASDTGDLTEAAASAGLNQDQVATVLPRLKAFLAPCSTD